MCNPNKFRRPDLAWIDGGIELDLFVVCPGLRATPARKHTLTGGREVSVPSQQFSDFVEPNSGLMIYSRVQLIFSVGLYCSLLLLRLLLGRSVD